MIARTNNSGVSLRRMFLLASLLTVGLIPIQAENHCQYLLSGEQADCREDLSYCGSSASYQADYKACLKQAQIDYDDCAHISDPEPCDPSVSFCGSSNQASLHLNLSGDRIQIASLQMPKKQFACGAKTIWKQ